jgi:hypothetical protein
LDTDLRKRYLVTEVLNMWEVSMGGSHTVEYVAVVFGSKALAWKELVKNNYGCTFAPFSHI